MFGKVRRKLSELRTQTSGNATLLVAIGMPALIGGSGLAVDISQWYMWKREMQYAVDQAALAGAWARSSSTTSVQDTYVTRARQEYEANLSMVGSFDTTPNVSLAAYGAGQTTNNSVVVTVTAAKQLPFSSFLTGKTTTVFAKAQATYTSSANWKVCIFATNPTASQAFKFGGSVSGSTTCGVGTLSNHPTAAMFEAGNTQNDLGNLVAIGGIDDSFYDNGQNRMHPNTSGLSDPYAGLSAPSSSGQTSRSYPATCPVASSAYTTADVTTRTAKTYRYYTKSGNTYTLVSYTGDGSHSDTDGYPGTTAQDQVVTSTTDTTNTSVSDYVKITRGSSTYYELTTTTVYTTYSDIQSHPAVSATVSLSPGIYTSISVACPTTFAPGIYWVSGSLDFGQNMAVTQSAGSGGVMFVMTGTAGAIHINSNSTVTLNGITETQLTSTYGVSASDASKMAGMLIFDKNSTDTLTINGNAGVKLGGTIYVPSRPVKMNGDGAAAGVCMMVAGNTVEFLGNFNIDNICQPDNAKSNIDIGGSTPSVKLVV